MSEEDVEILALRWARGQRCLSNRNVNCFVAGLEMARQWLINNLSEFLQDEGQYLLNEYREKRISDLGYSGIPLSEKHRKEFNGAKEVGDLLIEASRIMKENKVLN